MKRISLGVFIILIFFTFSFCFIENYNILSQNKFDDIHNKDIGINLKGSSVIGVINLTNYWINNTRHYRNSTVTIEGKIYKPLPPPPPYDNLSGVNVAIVVDGFLNSNYTATSDIDGEFQINYRIPFTMDVFSSYKIEVVYIDDLGIDTIYSLNFFIINIIASSYLDDPTYTDIPYVTGESLALSGHLRYNNENGAGIPNAQINYNWYNSSYIWSSSSFLTSATDGSISQSILIPTDVYSQELNLNLSYSGNFPFINNSQKIITINVFRDINCVWNIVSKATEGDNITITGQIFSNNSLNIYNRTLVILYDGALVDTVDTDANGFFTYVYAIPDGTGIKSVRIDLVNSASKQLNSITYINVTAGAVYNPSRLGGLPPFLMFSLVFFPILAGVIAVLAVFGYRYYKKQEKQSRVVILPLESKLINLKILKDSGRLEESLSYLFNGIFMDLINARYNRIKKDNETIRDFAIISVKELKLTPAAIYPFIQTVEKIIYGKPFQITEKDFYDTCELFSPIYFQLTGHNFVLSF